MVTFELRSQHNDKTADDVMTKAFFKLLLPLVFLKFNSE